MSDIGVGSTSDVASPTESKISVRDGQQETAGYMFPALSTPPHGPTALPLRPILPQKSALRGHQRSASHGGVATRPSISGLPSITGSGSAGVVSRPSALKTPGHQRAFSQGQITDSPGSGQLTRSGHSRVGSKTDFILPPGHKDESNQPGSAGSLFKPGHKRQASRSESIYTLRQGKKPTLAARIVNFVLRRKLEDSLNDNKLRTVVPNHLVPSVNKKDYPNNKWCDNKVCTTKYTLLSFIPKNLFEQFHRVANLHFIFIVLLNWFPAINAFGKEISMIPVLFVLGVTAIKDLFEDRRRHVSDKRINKSTCRIYDGKSGRYTKVQWRDVRVGDIIHLSNNELIPADVLILRSSDPHGLCYIDTCNLDGETNLKQRTVVRGLIEKQQVFEPSQFRSLVEVDAPTTKIYRFHGSLVHPSGERIPVSTDNLLLRECVVKNTDYVEGIVVYAGHETKAMLNNGGPRYKRSGVEKQMNRDIIWCVLILLVLCVVGAVGCKMWLSSYQLPLPHFLPFAGGPGYEGFLTFFTFIIILQIMIPLSLYVTVEMTKLLQIYHIHHDPALYDVDTNKRIECRALNITEEVGQVQYIFSDKTGTLTENKMIFRRCTVDCVDYNHPPPQNVQELKTKSGTPIPLLINPKMQEDLSYINKLSAKTNEDQLLTNELLRLSDASLRKIEESKKELLAKMKHAQKIQELLLVLTLCNTVVVSKHPHHDQMDASGVIELPTSNNLGSPDKCSLTLNMDSFEGNVDRMERYTRLCESRSVSPSPPPQVSLLDNHNQPSTQQAQQPNNKLLSVPALLFVSRKQKGNTNNRSTTPSPVELKPIFEAESPDELALVDMAHSYDCKLLRRTPVSATVSVPGEGVLDYDILRVLPFDPTRKSMSVVVRHPLTKDIILYCKGADTTILPHLAPTDDVEQQQVIFRTQQHLNSYARQGLRVLVMAKRMLTEVEYSEWCKKHADVELLQEGRERKLIDSYSQLETNLTLVGATGIEDRLQEGVPECIAQLMSAGIVVWVLTGDKPETAVNVAYSARLFSPQMEVMNLAARSKTAAENAINFYLADIKAHSPIDAADVRLDQSGVFGRGEENPPRLPGPLRPNRKRALVVDGKTLTYILDARSKLQRPFLELTRQCASVLCCRATPLQKAYIVKIVKEILHKRTLAIGDGANDVSMIQTADVGVGISGQEGMQAIMASDFALARFKYLERFLLVHGHWCYDRLSRMVLYFFYKNATFVFLIFWFQLYCGYSGQVMIDQMYLMLYNLMFTSLPPLAIGVYEQDAPEELLLANPSLYKQGRLGLVYHPHSFWITMADTLYQSIVIFFIALGAYNNSDIGLWEFGSVIASSCMFIMLVQVAMETKSWTYIHILSLAASLGLFFAYSFVYDGLCVSCFGLPSQYWIMQTIVVTPTYWLVIILSVVAALVPRFLWLCHSRWLSPQDVARAVRDRKQHVARGEDFLVSWSRSTSTSSIYRTIDTGTKCSSGRRTELTSVG